MRVPGRERDRRPPAGDEPRDDDDVEAAPLELLLRPLEAAACLVGAEQPLDGVLARVLADRVRDVVSDDRPARGGHDHAEEPEIAARGEVAGRDDDALARDDREERVDHRHGEDQRVAPPRPGDPLGELAEHGSASSQSRIRR